MSPIWASGVPHMALTVPGLADASLPGQPRLPSSAVLVGLPPSGGWQVRLLEMERRVIPLVLPVAPAPPADLAWSGSGAPAALATALSPASPGTQTADTVFSPPVVDQGEAFLLRDLRVVRLGLHPVRYNPAAGELEHIQKMVVEVLFEEPAAVAARRHDGWDALLARAVLNYDVARTWRGVRAVRPAETVASNPAASTAGSFKVEVDRDGLYQLGYEDLERVGFPVGSVDPQNLHLVVNGNEVALQVEVGPDGKFSPGDWLLFYGQAATSRYTHRTVYWLFSDETPGVRMASRSVVPRDVHPVPATRWLTNHLEENHLYDGLYSEPSGDHWYWTDLGFLQTGCPEAAQSYPFDLPQLRAGAYDARLRISLQGHTFNTHNLLVKVNGHPVGRFVWDGPNRNDSELTFPAALLEPAENLLRVENGDCPPQPAAYPNKVVLNYFEVSHLAGYEATKDADGRPLLDFRGETGKWQYELDGFTTANVGLFDLTDPNLPVALTGADWVNGRLVFEDEAGEPRRYRVTAQTTIRTPLVYPDTPSDLRSPSLAADYLLIGYGPFLPATQPLVELRTAQGLRVVSVDVQDVYDEFSYGLLDPGAIREFLAYVAAWWDGLPTYVLLVGDGTIDYHDHRGNGWHNYLPPYPANVELHAGPYPAETASDNQLDPGAVLPLFQIGRLPVTSVEQTQSVVAKIVRYETLPAPPFWNRKALFVADKTDPSQGEQSFAQHSDGVFHSLIAPLQGDRVYLATAPTQPHEFQAQAARAAIRARLISGRLVVTFMGHSSPSQWSADILLHRDDVPLLQNGGRLPVVLSMTCYTGAFQWPDYAPLDERLVMEPTGGAVAAWGSTGAAVATGHRHLAQGFFDALQGEEPVRLGSATYAGLVRLYTQAPTAWDLIDTYVLLGDPALVLDRYAGSITNSYLPLALRGR